MTRITVDIDQALLAVATEVLGTHTKVATINAALQEVARRKGVIDMLAVFDSIEMDYSGSQQSFRLGAGRDLSRLDENARLDENPRPVEPASDRELV